MMAKHRVAPVAEIGPGERKLVDVAGISIGVFNVGGTFYALKNRCPHQGAPLCLGSLKGTTLPSAPGEYVWARDGEVLRCPWHGWEFDVTNGKSLFNPHRVRVRAYEVTVEPQGGEASGTEEADPSVETFPVTVESDWITLHL